MEPPPAATGQKGVFLTASSYDNVIGSSDGIPSNLIANNIANGIFADSGSGNAFVRNSIYSNTALGIDLAAGANLNQAAPVLTTVQIVGSNLQVSGTLTSQAKSTFTVEFFANTTSSAAGRYFLGSQQVSTDASGNAAFVFLGPLPPMGANFITATVTDPDNNTSEFSAAVS